MSGAKTSAPPGVLLVAARRSSARFRAILLPALLPSTVALAVVAAAVALAAPARTPPALSELLEGGGSAVGVVALDATVMPGSSGGADGTLIALEVRASGETRALRVPVRLLSIVAEERLAFGTRVEARRRVIPTEASDDRAALLAPMGAVEVADAAPALLSAADGLRARFLALASAFTGDGAALLPGLAIGDTSAVGDDLDEAMKRSSLSHLTAVSGANVAIRPVQGLV